LKPVEAVAVGAERVGAGRSRVLTTGEGALDEAREVEVMGMGGTAGGFEEVGAAREEASVFRPGWEVDSGLAEELHDGPDFGGAGTTGGAAREAGREVEVDKADRGGGAALSFFVGAGTGAGASFLTAGASFLTTGASFWTAVATGGRGAAATRRAVGGTGLDTGADVEPVVEMFK
jgi:hypothetical protein